MTHTDLGLLVLSGSSGRLETRRCEVLREHGIAAVPVQWFGGPGQPATPRNVALETFWPHLDRLDHECRRLGILGTSFGAEAALLVAARDVRVSAVIALSPTSVVWQSPDLADGHPVQDAKWTWRGQPVPGVPYVDQSGLDLADAREVHEKSVAALNGSRADYEIPVESIDASVVVTAGGADRVWQSATFCEEIVARRAHHGQDTRYLFEAAAGHRVVLPGEEPPTPRADLPAGGDPDADRALGEQLLAAILDLVD
ncbi:hypothetical protein ASG90_16805 [Nocardioides sp. Soil797]|nr:hypothetical protein ASG90_16805 [Nocardioides sp. Soil797]